MVVVQIEIRSVYGNDMAYPRNATAKALANIAGTKTLTRHVLLNILAMGLDIQELDRYGNICRTIGNEMLQRIA